MRESMKLKLFAVQAWFVCVALSSNALFCGVSFCQEGAPTASSQESGDECRLPEVRDELSERVERDQAARFAMLEASQKQLEQSSEHIDSLGQRLARIDEENREWIKEQVKAHGWLGKSLVGEEGAHNAWLLVQHADQDLPFQESCLKQMVELPKGEVAAVDIAYLTDRVLSAQKKPQRYGTQCSVENGVARVKDVEDPENLNQRRTELGLEPIEDYLKKIESLYAGRRESAVQTAESLIARHEKEQSPVWIDGDRATFFYRGEAESVNLGLNGLSVPLTRLQESDVWFLEREMPQLAEGIFNYSINAAHEGIPAPNPYADRIAWRGPNAPEPITVAETLSGTVTQYELSSDHLTKKRKVSVYLPPGASDSNRLMPVVYMADGGSIELYAKSIEPLILAGRLPEMALIGVHSGRYDGEVLPDKSNYDINKDLRAAEYLPVLESEHFPRHEAFFCEEVTAWAEKKFGVSPDRLHRTVFGFSNGGRFAGTMGIRRSEVFGNVVALSVAGFSAPSLDPLPNQKSDFYFAAGVWEEGFHKRSLEFHQAVSDAGLNSHFSSRVAGHDSIMWQEELVAALLRIHAERED